MLIFLIMGILGVFVLSMDEADPYGASANDDEMDLPEAGSEPLEDDLEGSEDEPEEVATDEAEADDEPEAEEPDAPTASELEAEFLAMGISPSDGARMLREARLANQVQQPQAGFPQTYPQPNAQPTAQPAFQPQQGQLPSFEDYLAANPEYQQIQAEYDEAVANEYDVAQPRMELRILKSELRAEYRDQVAAIQQQQSAYQAQVQAAQNQWQTGVTALAADKTFKAHLDTPAKQQALTAYARSKGITDPQAAAWAFLGPKIANAQKNAARSTTTKSRNVAAVPAGNSGGAGVGTNEHPPDTIDSSRERTAWYRKYNPDYLLKVAREARR